MKYRYKPDGYKPTTEIFVFGSNLAGIHGAGAAKEATEKYGAIRGCGIGLKGQSYAIPTKDRDIHTLPIYKIKEHVREFLKMAKMFSNDDFYVSRVGCGLAGYTDSQIAPMFRGASENCIFAEQWKEYLEHEDQYFIRMKNLLDE